MDLQAGLSMHLLILIMLDVSVLFPLDDISVMQSMGSCLLIMNIYLSVLVQGSHNHGKSGKVMEKSWKIIKISKVMEKLRFYPSSRSKYSQRFGIFQNCPVMNLCEKFARILTLET